MERLPKFSRDNAYKKRGGTARWLLLGCGACKEDFALYQKDGQGNLYRLYLDRLASTTGERPFRDLGKSAISALRCASCDELIATPMTYENDRHPRTALRLVDVGVYQKNLHNQASIRSTPELNIKETMASIVD